MCHYVIKLKEKQQQQTYKKPSIASALVSEFQDLSYNEQESTIHKRFRKFDGQNGRHYNAICLALDMKSVS